MVDASALPPCVTAAMKVSDQPLDSDNGVVGEMVAELKRVLVHGKREGVSSTPTDATPSKSKSEPHVARNLIVDMGLSSQEVRHAEKIGDLLSRLEAAERARSEAEQSASKAWERLTELQQSEAVMPKMGDGTAAQLAQRNETLIDTATDQMLRIRSLERDLTHKSVRTGQLEADLRTSEAVREDLESRILELEKICSAVITVATTKERETEAAQEVAATLELANCELLQTTEDLSGRVDELSLAKTELESEVATLGERFRHLQTTFDEQLTAEVSDMRGLVEDLEDRLREAKESLALSTVDSYRRQKMLVSCEVQTMPEVTVAKMQNRPYGDTRLHHLEVGESTAWVQSLKMWYMTASNLAPKSRKQIKKEVDPDGSVSVDKGWHELGVKTLHTLVRELQSNKVFTFDDVVSPSTRRLKGKAKAKEVKKEPVLKEFRAEVEILQTRGRQWLNKVETNINKLTTDISSTANKLSTDITTTAQSSAQKPKEIGKRIGEWWAKISKPSEEAMVAAANAAAERTVDAAVGQAITFLTTKSKTVSFLTHEEASALSEYRNRAAAHEALEKLRLTLTNSPSTSTRS